MLFHACLVTVTNMADARVEPATMVSFDVGNFRSGKFHGDRKARTSVTGKGLGQVNKRTLFASS